MPIIQSLAFSFHFGQTLSITLIYYYYAYSFVIFPSFFHASYFALSTTLILLGADPLQGPSDI